MSKARSMRVTRAGSSRHLSTSLQWCGDPRPQLRMTSAHHGTMRAIRTAKVRTVESPWLRDAHWRSSLTKPTLRHTLSQSMQPQPPRPGRPRERERQPNTGAKAKAGKDKAPKAPEKPKARKAASDPERQREAPTDVKRPFAGMTREQMLAYFEPKVKKKRQPGLSPIVAYEGKPDIDWRSVFAKMTVPMSLLELLQASPEACKQLRGLSTRKHAKAKDGPAVTAKLAALLGLDSEVAEDDDGASEADIEALTEFMASLSTQDVTVRCHQGEARYDPFGEARLFGESHRLTRPFRVTANVIGELGNGRGVRFIMPENTTQADQGSEVNVIAPDLIRHYSLHVRTLASIGFLGLRIGTSDERAIPLTHFTKLSVTVEDIIREVWAVVRPEGVLEGGVKLLLGLPWLWQVDAKIGIREAQLMIGDQSRNEELRIVRGPRLAPSDRHKLILVPAPTATVEPPVIQDLSSQRSSSDSQDSDAGYTSSTEGVASTEDSEN
ncbi:hypothetical protein B0T11DRAFT_64 [Plectosphaerella cucumerina]|uniref:Uncharacterized protein n=1 Tax=Plectosphaerella cucumerina TaxID=40658 RepID=A0A8K0TND8_9PEZI|nr:hypothetical protein B0T11DRAFT_64 [Plectosphaerella cucumerina]